MRMDFTDNGDVAVYALHPVS